MSAATLPAFLEPLVDGPAMRALDRWAIDARGIPSLDLMEHAGAALAKLTADVADGPIAVVCGTGNNGGDGLVAARLLHAGGREVRALLVGERTALSADAAASLERVEAAGGRVESFAAGALDGATVVDCLLGTGFSGAPRGAIGVAITTIADAAAAAVVAADVPSGVDASTGEVPGAAVRATATVTFGAAKIGLWVHPGKAHAGELVVADIGIPDGGPVEGRVGLIGPSALGAIPRRLAASTKLSSGRVAICGGSPGLSGAPALAAAAALRAGAGYVTACVPAAVAAVLDARLAEVMTFAIPERAVADAVLAKAPDGALVVGPGLGREGDAVELARELARRAALPLVLDADGLYAHDGRLEALRGRTAPTVLTPHEGELGRLLGVDADEVRARRLVHAREAAARSGAIVVLKGDDTIVARPDGLAAINPVSAPALATAGTGDVLAGVLGAMLAKGIEPFAAACAAVRLHAEAGRLAAALVGSAEGVIASDVIGSLPRAREVR